MRKFLVPMLLLLSAGSLAGATATLVQQTAGSSSAAPSTTYSLTFPKNTTAGNLLIVSFDYPCSVSFVSVKDTQGNYFFQPGNMLTSPSNECSRSLAAKAIKGGPDTITVTVSGPAAIELYPSEYTNADQVTPVDVQSGSYGPAGPVTSGSAVTKYAGETIYGWCLGDWSCTVGTGFTARSTFNSNLVEDMVAGAAGPYAATATANNGWTMQMLAIKPASITPPPVPSVTFSPTTLTFPTQVPNTVSPAQLVTMTNSGTGTLTINGITMGGLNGGEFSQTNTCGTSLAAGASCTISVVFAPAATRTASLSVTDNSSTSPQSVGLTGTVGGGTVTHHVNVTWTNSITPGVTGYNILKSPVSGGPYTQLNGGPVTVQPFLDVAVTPGSTNCYVLNSTNGVVQSGHSNESCATVPNP